MFKAGLSNMMQKAQKLQQNVEQAQAEIKNLSAIGVSNDAIKISINGEYKIQKIEINDDMINNKEMLIQSLTTAFNDASTQIKTQSASKMSIATGGLNIPF